MRGGGTLVVKAEDLTIKSIEQSEVEERVRVENEVIHFDDYDEYATYTLVLENPTSTKLQVTNINLTNNECVSINTDELENTIVEPNSTKEITLTLTSNKCNVNQDNTALLSFKSKEYTEDKQEEKEDIVSPNTYGNISIFLVVLFILTAIYISLYIYSKKNPFKYMKLSTIIYLSLLVITTITYTIMTSFSANEESLSLTFSYTYKPRRILMKRNHEDWDYGCYECIPTNDEGTFWENYSGIKKLYIQNIIEEPDEYEEVYDASMNQDGSILVYKVTNPDDDSYYDLYMMADGEIFANIDSTGLFANMFGYGSTISDGGIIHLENLDTSLVENMTDMFASYMSNIPLDLSHLDTSNVTNMFGMFGNVGNEDIEEMTIDVSNFDTSNVTNMSYMFDRYDGGVMKIVGLENFNTSKVTNMSEMFGGYSSSAPLDLSHLDTSKVTNMSWMFSGYSSDAKLDLSHLDTSNVTNMSWMFADYSSSAPLDLSHFDTSNVTNMSFMFDWWNSTADLDISSMNLTTLPPGMFNMEQKANKIYVANDTVKNLLLNSGWPYMTDENIIVKTN